MGTDIHVKIVKRNRETDLWEQIKLYHKKNDEIKLIDIYPFRNSELFDILNENEDDNYTAYPLSLINLPKDLQEEIEEKQNIIGYFGFREINLADLKLYLYKTPKVRNWDYEDDNHPKAWKDNPVKYFMERIEQYIDLADSDWSWFAPCSDIKILYWFDC